MILIIVMVMMVVMVVMVVMVMRLGEILLDTVKSILFGIMVVVLKNCIGDCQCQIHPLCNECVDDLDYLGAGGDESDGCDDDIG